MIQRERRIWCGFLAFYVQTNQPKTNSQTKRQSSKKEETPVWSSRFSRNQLCQFKWKGHRLEAAWPLGHRLSFWTTTAKTTLNPSRIVVKKSPIEWCARARRAATYEPLALPNRSHTFISNPFTIGHSRVRRACVVGRAHDYAHPFWRPQSKAHQ